MKGWQVLIYGLGVLAIVVFLINGLFPFINLTKVWGSFYTGDYWYTFWTAAMAVGTTLLAYTALQNISETRDFARRELESKVIKAANSFSVIVNPDGGDDNVFLKNGGDEFAIYITGAEQRKVFFDCNVPNQVSKEDGKDAGGNIVYKVLSLKPFTLPALEDLARIEIQSEPLVPIKNAPAMLPISGVVVLPDTMTHPERNFFPTDFYYVELVIVFRVGDPDDRSNQFKTKVELMCLGSRTGIGDARIKKDNWTMVAMDIKRVGK